MKDIKFTYEADSSMGTSDSQNILIKGNNKEILPSLTKEFGGRIKCVYITRPTIMETLTIITMIMFLKQTGSKTFIMSWRI